MTEGPTPSAITHSGDVRYRPAMSQKVLRRRDFLRFFRLEPSGAIQHNFAETRG